jgi:hypothetical protein
MKNVIKNTIKKVAIVVFVFAAVFSAGLNVYQYEKGKQMEAFVIEYNDTLNNACDEAMAKMDISDQLLIENVFERHFSDEKIEELETKYWMLNN